MNELSQRIWGNAWAGLARTRRLRLTDLLLFLGLAGGLFALVTTGEEWAAPLRPSVEIDLSPRALPYYTLLSLSRGLAAYALSLSFTFLYGYWAAKDRSAERILVPLLDILQSIPVLGFMPGLVLFLVHAFPHHNAGLELSAVLMIFTGQAWNMTFSYYHSLKSVPPDQSEVATVYRFSKWQRLKWVELPFSVIGLVWNSMMSMAGGWFFLMISEAFVLGDRDFRLPGLGSYMSVAVAHGDVSAMLWAIAAMTSMIVTLDQLVWRPVVVWSQKFRVEEGSESVAMRSWFLDLLHRSAVWNALWRHWQKGRSHAGKPRAISASSPSIVPRWWSHLASGGLVVLLAAGSWRLFALLRPVPLETWVRTLTSGLLTLGRVLLATVLGTLWTLPAGLAIGLSPRLSRILQPVVQVVASFPAPMLFPAVIALLRHLGIGLGIGSVLLMLLGTQWYIFFNVIAGATAIPADLREAAESYRLSRWQRFWSLYCPAVFPYLVTGWVTAAGGAWNASIVSEYVTFRGETFSTIGLGATISQSASGAQLSVLAASVLVMAVLVVAFNRIVWHPMHRLAETRFSLSK